jgi:DNA-binding response OmpR family regulator
MEGDKKTILIVEDEFHIRDIIKIVLEMEGFSIVEASNGREALEILADTNPDLIITDIMMPEMDGIQFYLTLKESEATSSIPVFVLTVKSQFEDVKYAALLGMDEYMTKPFDPRDLIDKVRSTFDKQ